jgi:hypothetical protein
MVKEIMKKSKMEEMRGRIKMIILKKWMWM